MSRGREMREHLDRIVYSRLVYPGTDVMINRLGLRDGPSLALAERAFAAERFAEGLPEVAKAPTYDGLKALHRHLFQDVYDWAGKEREYTTRRSDVATFAPPQFIGRNMEAIFKDFRSRDELRGLDPEAFARGAAHFVSAINGVHPFNDGNGRVQRAWLGHIADGAGFKFEIKAGERGEWHAASRVAFEKNDLRQMADFIGRAIGAPERAPLSPSEDIANRFMSLTRADALATGDKTLVAGWKTLDVFRASMEKTFPRDPDKVETIVLKAHAQLGERIRDGRSLVLEKVPLRPVSRSHER